MAEGPGFACRAGCGACCIAPSINRPFFGMPGGKRAGEACVHLDEAMRCRIFDDPKRPALCDAFAPERAVCGDSREDALATIALLEIDSAPAAGARR